MSAKKPPPRPPLPRLSTAKSGQPTGVAPERSLRNAFASLSIRYSNSTKESDSEEEISIVRKDKTEVPDGSDGGEGNESKEGHKYKVTRRVCEPDGSAFTSRPEESSHAEGKSSSATSLAFPNKSLSTQELRQAPEKKTVIKQSTWPSYPRADVPDSGAIMKFLRGRDREREQENEPKCEPSKEGLSLSDKEPKDETDPGSLPSKNHVDNGSDGNLKAKGKRSRSPSPFRLLGRDRQVESTNTGDNEKPKASSGISLSSLLASIAKDEAHSEVEEKISDIEEIESNPDIVSEIPSSPEFSLNFCHDHFEEERTESRTRLLSRPVIDKSPQFANFCLCCLIVYIYFVTTWPPFVSGVVFGTLLAYLGGCAFLWLFCPEDTAAERYERELFEYEERLARTPKPDYKSVDPGLLLKRHKLEASIQFKSGVS